ncbi:hypothetical protein [Rathayibacter sp. VKM Ac-2760]|uniref:hypothetical protein n=1 Tax=Rathayibacter sp. VKM Ac-2760 TaxID=2609253 RepID=UPI00131612E0|nr:hypothetical protein [Rathayibacter sp. VKM Ac-2760]QHC58622.1 hypothetical protein GSU72_08725 [Rathayibacter sp. VKM Ac-2760]
MVENAAPKWDDAGASALSVVGVVGALVSAVLGMVGAGLSLLALGWCAQSYRGFLLLRNDPPLDCLAQPEGPFAGWFLVVGLGAALSFVCLVVGSRPRWDAHGGRRSTRGVPAFVTLATITVVSAVLTYPLS